MSTFEFYYPEKPLSTDEIVDYIYPRIVRYVSAHYAYLGIDAAADLVQAALFAIWYYAHLGRLNRQQPGHWWMEVKHAISSALRPTYYDKSTVTESDFDLESLDSGGTGGHRQHGPCDPDHGQCDTRIDNERLIRKAWELIAPEHRDECYKAMINLAYDGKVGEFTTAMGWTRGHYDTVINRIKVAFYEAAGMEVPTRRPAHRKGGVDEATLQRLASKGYGNYKIAKMVGCSPKTVYAIFARAEGKTKRTMKA